MIIRRSPFEISLGQLNTPQLSSTMKTRIVDYGAPPPQNVATWSMPDTPSTSTIKTISDYYSNDPKVDVNLESYVSESAMAQMTYQTYQYPHGYDPLTTTVQAMHSPSYGDYPELPSMGPTNPFCPDQSYQNREGIIPYPYPDNSMEQTPYLQGAQYNYFQYPQYPF